jgi:hypothetical protein
MYNEINKVEKLTKEERDFLEKNLRICFDVIVESTGAKSFDIENDMGNKEKFLKEFSPWHQKKGKGQELIQKFVDIVNNDQSTEDFSWLDILDEDSQWKKPGNDKIKKEVKDKSKHVNMRYQIPTHFHGDIDNAVLFYCMENPRGYLGDYKDSKIDEEFQGETLNEFYIYSANKRLEESKTLKEIVKERYQLNDFTTDSIEKIIYSNSKDETPLRRELENMFKENKEFFGKTYILKKDKRSKKPVLSDKYYYISRYYAQLLEINGENLKKYNIESEDKKEAQEAQVEQDKAIKISEKICNVEIYPFSSSEPKLEGKGIGNTILLNSDLSRLGVYIVLRRIYRYLDNEAEKPVIIFRKYDRAWKELFDKILQEVEEEEKQKDRTFEHEKVLNLLEEGFFYCQTGSMGGGITDGNVISVPNFKRISDELKETKEKDFKSIKSLLTKE